MEIRAMNARCHRRDRAAFTLMEVLLVLVILVILGSLAVNVFSGVRKSANIQAAQVQVDALSKACQTYSIAMNTFPSTLDDLRVAPNLPNAASWAGPYIDRNMNEVADPWGNPYQYQYPGSRYGEEKPDIWSWGPDGQNGTADDIYNK
jgi:general secretion pathway protein G